MPLKNGSYYGIAENVTSPVTGKHYQPTKKAYILREADRTLLELARPKPKNCTHFCSFPVMVDSASMYYRTDWVTGTEYWTLREKYGSSVQLLREIK